MATAFASYPSPRPKQIRAHERSGTAAVVAALGAQPVTEPDLIQELRDKGLVGPISAEFLDEYRAQREFSSLMEAVAAVPGGMAKLRRALARIGLLPSEDPGDLELLSAWIEWCTALRDSKALGDNPTVLDEAAVDARYNAADDFLRTAQPSTLAGALVKLRRAVATAGEERWVEQALVDGDDATLFSRAEELDPLAVMLIDAIAVLTALAGEK